MAKHFSEVIDEIMPLVDEENAPDPFVIVRNKDLPDAPWFVEFPHPQEDLDAYLRQVRELDPYAVLHRGADFDGGSTLFVLDTALAARLSVEERFITENRADGVNTDKLGALRLAFDDFIGVQSLPQAIVDYLTSIDNPLQWLYDEFGADLDLSATPLTKDERNTIFAKFRAEYDVLTEAADFNDDYSSLLEVLESDQSFLSDTALRYLSEFDAPLTKLFEMIPFELCYDESAEYGKAFNSFRLREAIDIASDNIDADVSSVGSLDRSQRESLFAAIDKRCALSLAAEHIPNWEDIPINDRGLVANIQSYVQSVGKVTDISDYAIYQTVQRFRDEEKGGTYRDVGEFILNEREHPETEQEPPVKEQTKPVPGKPKPTRRADEPQKKPSILGDLDASVKEAARRAEQRGTSPAKKRGNMEVE